MDVDNGEASAVALGQCDGMKVRLIRMGREVRGIQDFLHVDHVRPAKENTSRSRRAGIPHEIDDFPLSFQRQEPCRKTREGLNAALYGDPVLGLARNEEVWQFLSQLAFQVPGKEAPFCSVSLAGQDR